MAGDDYGKLFIYHWSKDQKKYDYKCLWRILGEGGDKKNRTLVNLKNCKYKKDRVYAIGCRSSLHMISLENCLSDKHEQK